MPIDKLSANAFATGAVANSLGYTPANKAGDTFTGNVVFSANATVTGAAAFSNTVAMGSDYLSPYMGFKNRIINGDMRIDQRYAGANVAVSSSRNYYLDRFTVFAQTSSKLTIQQNQNSVTPPAGFTNYAGITVSTAVSSLPAADQYMFEQQVEGYNIADFDFGKSTAKNVTLSFWVRSSLTGTFAAVMCNGSEDRSYPFTYTISSANTWEQKTVTIAGDTTGTWPTTNASGLRIKFNLGTGTTYSGTANAWTSSAYITSVTGSVNLINTLNATFYMTGVQLEKGSTATAFDYRDFGRELIMCQRYYETNLNYGTTISNFSGGSNSPSVRAMYVGGNGGSQGWSHDWKVAKRATPSVTVYSTLSPAYAAGQLNNAGTNVGATVTNVGNNSAFIYAAGNNMYFNFAVDAEL